MLPRLLARLLPHRRTMTDFAGRQDRPWHAAFPLPVSNLKDGTLASLTAQELWAVIEQERGAPVGRSYLVVDVRRVDFTESVRCSSPRRFPLLVELYSLPLTHLLIDTLLQPYLFKGAINLPAYSFYPTLPSLLPLFSSYVPFFPSPPVHAHHTDSVSSSSSFSRSHITDTPA
jgi:hypothetical protein